MKAEAGVDGDEPPPPRRPASEDGEHNRVDPEAAGAAVRAEAVWDLPSEGAGGNIHIRLDSRGLPMFARPGQVSPTPSYTTLSESPSHVPVSPASSEARPGQVSPTPRYLSSSHVPVSPASREASETARGETGFTVPPGENRNVASAPEDSLSLADRRIEQQQVKTPRKLSFQSVQKEEEPQDEDAQLREQQEIGARESRGNKSPMGGVEATRRGSIIESFTGLFRSPSFTRTPSFASTGSFLPNFTRTSSFGRLSSSGSRIAAGEDGSASGLDNTAGQHSGTRSNLSRWLSTGSADFRRGSADSGKPTQPMQHSAEDRLRQVFEQASGILTSKTESAQNTEWENLFVSIAGDRDSTISVSGDLGETLIRLGISIEFRTLQKTIHKVCFIHHSSCAFIALPRDQLCYATSA